MKFCCYLKIINVRLKFQEPDSDKEQLVYVILKSVYIRSNVIL